MKTYKQKIVWLFGFPVIACFYVGLFVTMALWYPDGLQPAAWKSHVLHFSIIYIFWLLVLYAYRLFDLDTLRSLPVLFTRLVGALVVCAVVATVYFYFQPELLITPRRFLLVQLLIAGLCLTSWYVFMHLVLPRTWQIVIYAHETLPDHADLSSLIQQHNFLGIKYGGVVSATDQLAQFVGATIVFPARAQLSSETARSLFALRRNGASFIDYPELYERITRTVHLETLTEMWFLQSVNYGSHRWSDAMKRLVDLLFGTVTGIIWLATLPLIAVLIKLDSSGPVFFRQERVGQHGKIFPLIKYRTMTSSGVNDTWTSKGDDRITWVGRWLRRLRIDELPQTLNILRGEMSVVGPRPEQVQIVEDLRSQIPYYDERHIVKPGLTGWAQLHVYAGNLEETKRKLQYDLYYIKHRSLLFDLEIITKTIYNILTFDGQ